MKNSESFMILISIFLAVWLAYEFCVRRRSLAQRKTLSQRTADTELSKLSTRSPSVYSMTGRSLSFPREEIKRTVPVSLSSPKTLYRPATSPQENSQSSVPFIPSNPSTGVDFADLKMQLNELADLAWSTQQPWSTSKFLLSPADIDQAAKPEQVVKIFLDHAARSVPGFQVPSMTPHTIVTSVPFAAGMFEADEAGWVTIKLNSDFFRDRLAAHSILAHEVCHYILDNHGFRKSDVLLNERYTDLCMFICGFGQVFLAGYKREETEGLGCGHRLGYLTDLEYEFAQQHTLYLRQLHKQNASNELDLLKTRLSQLLQGDKGACHRHIKAERERNPHWPEIELYRDVINQIERDRR